MRLPEYDQLDALALADLVRRGQVPAAELLEAALERADARDPALGALARRFDDEARARAAGPLPPGPLSGVPFLLKDHLTAWAGHPLTSGSRYFAGHVPPEDSLVVHRLLAAGLIPFGQTRASELGIVPVTEPAAMGPSRNPWDLARTPGGSSGGSAAAVAARIVPAAHGNDSGGSLRMPASCCALFALKPSRGRVALGPLLGHHMSGLTVEGVLTRSVRDSAALLDVLAGGAPGDPWPAPPQARPFLEEVRTPPGALRIAVTRRPLLAHATHPACAAAVEDAARLLAELGHEVEEAHPDLHRERLIRAYLVVLSAQVALDVRERRRDLGRGPRRGELEPETAALAAAGRRLRAWELAEAEVEMHRAARALAAFHARYDLLVTATQAQPPLPLGALQARGLERLGVRLVEHLPLRALLDAMFAAVGQRAFDATGNTMLFNQTGQPAMSLPLGWTGDGLPVGVQVAARHGDEATLFRLAAQVEAARPWARRLPPLLAAPAHDQTA
ncbi:MAG: amidase [Anaeromyxobacter sp.]